MKKNDSRVRTAETLVKRCLALIGVALVLLAEFRVPADQVVADGVIYTSLVRLLAHPVEYESRKVQVVGYYIRGQELSGLFLSKADARSGNTQAAVWINVEGSTNNLINRKIKSGAVMVIGTFHSDPKDGVGHMGVWPGELRNLTFMQKRR